MYQTILLYTLYGLIGLGIISAFCIALIIAYGIIAIITFPIWGPIRAIWRHYHPLPKPVYSDCGGGGRRQYSSGRRQYSSAEAQVREEMIEDAHVMAFSD